MRENIHDMNLNMHTKAYCVNTLKSNLLLTTSSPPPLPSPTCHTDKMPYQSHLQWHKNPHNTHFENWADLKSERWVFTSEIKVDSLNE